MLPATSSRPRQDRCWISSLAPVVKMNAISTCTEPWFFKYFEHILTYFKHQRLSTHVTPWDYTFQIAFWCKRIFSSPLTISKNLHFWVVFSAHLHPSSSIFPGAFHTRPDRCLQLQLFHQCRQASHVIFRFTTTSGADRWFVDFQAHSVFQLIQRNSRTGTKKHRICWNTVYNIK